MNHFQVIPLMSYCRSAKQFSAPPIEPFGIILVFALLFALFLCGCDNTSPKASTGSGGISASGRLTATSTPAKEVIQQMIQRYQRLTSYEDRAVVELRYQYDGRPAVDQAPMSVAWDLDGGLGLRVYSLIAGPSLSGQRWLLSLGDKYPEIHGQVLSRAKPETVELPWLLSEPLVGMELAAGLAGFPVALDLLLNSDPLSGLLENVDSWELHSAQSASGTQYFLVKIRRQQLEYRFWIDQQTYLLRRIDLPTQSLPKEISSDPKVSDVQLFIDFQRVSIDKDIDWQEFRVDVSPSDLRVNRFVTTWTGSDLRGLGLAVPAFQLLGPDGVSRYDSTPSQSRRASVLIWLANHPGCLAASEQLSAVEKTLRASGISQQQVEFVSIWAEPEPPPGLTFSELKESWKMPGLLVLDPGAAGRDLFSVEEAPTLVLLDAQGKLQWREARVNPVLDQTLPQLIFKMLAGTSLAEEVLRAQETAELHNQAELALAAASDRLGNHPALPPHYPPARTVLTPVSKRTVDSKISCLVQDELEVPWVLTADGVLSQLNASLESVYQIQTSWMQRSQASPLMKPSADGRFFAFSNRLDSSVHCLDLRSGESIKFQLPESAVAAAFYWLRIPAVKTPRLAVLSSSNRIVLLDPDNRQQLSGSCARQPVAIIGEIEQQPDHSLLASRVILSDGQVDFIRFPKLSSNSSLVHPAGLTGPSDTVSVADLPSRLNFQAALGPWLDMPVAAKKSAGDLSRALGCGWLAAEEPALFFIDNRLVTQNYYRLPASKQDDFPLQSAVALSPVNGQPLWAVLDDKGIVHLLHADALWSDHFRPIKRPVGLSLLAAGDSLLLILAQHDELTTLRIE